LTKGEYREQQAALTALATIKNEASISLIDTYLGKAIRNEVSPEIHLDIIEAAEALDDEQLKPKINTFLFANGGQPGSIEAFYPTLFGGDAGRGANIFYEHEAAQCVRCHTVFEMGGTAGPGLAGVADRLQPKELLQSMIEPSAQFAAGYELVRLELQDGQALTGIVMEETEDLLTLKVGQEVQEFEKGTITERTPVPSSVPPMGSILTKREIRDLVAFLKGLHTES
jgi:putative heme-binding domain-containing protein